MHVLLRVIDFSFKILEHLYRCRSIFDSKVALKKFIYFKLATPMYCNDFNQKKNFNNLKKTLS